jgi:hypothetical protein
MRRSSHYWAVIFFHPSRFGCRAKLTPAMWNKQTSSWDGNWFYCWVPVEQTANARGKGNYPLSSTMTRLNHLMEAPSDCGSEDTNFLAFVEATSIISGHDAVEEFLACGLWPLSAKFGFKVEMKESPLSKVVVPMLQVTPIIGAQEPGAAFEAWIVNSMNLLVGNYNITEHNAYSGLQHGRLNRILELAEVLYQPQPESIVWKCKSAAPAPRKASEKWKHTKGSSH